MCRRLTVSSVEAGVLLASYREDLWSVVHNLQADP